MVSEPHSDLLRMSDLHGLKSKAPLVAEQVRTVARQSMRHSAMAVQVRATSTPSTTCSGTEEPGLCAHTIWGRSRQVSASAAQVLAGGRPEDTNAFLQLLAQAARAGAQGAAAGGTRSDPQHHPAMEAPLGGPAASSLPAAEAGYAAPPSVEQSKGGWEAHGATEPGKARRPQSARRGPPAAARQVSAPNQARGLMHSAAAAAPASARPGGRLPWRGCRGLLGG